MCARVGGEQILATLSIITNSLLVGVTSYGLYFYFPDMSIVESLWYVPAHTALYLRPVLARPQD
jgi:ABC-type transport system involved in cytochrome c biogenesis permease subunit